MDEKIEINIENKKYYITFNIIDKYIKINIIPDNLLSIFENQEFIILCGKENINDSINFIINDIKTNNFNYNIIEKNKDNKIQPLKLFLKSKSISILFSNKIQFSDNNKKNIEEELSEAIIQIRKLIERNNELFISHEELKNQNKQLISIFNLKIDTLKNYFTEKLNTQTNKIEQLQKVNNELYSLSKNLTKKIIDYQKILNDSTIIQKKIEFYIKKTEIKSHKKRINNFAKFPNSNKFASCSDDYGICIYDKINSSYETIIKIEKAHSYWILDILAYDSNHLISVGCDYFIKIFQFDFNNKSYKNICEYKRAHDTNIQRIIKLSKDIFATCSNDCKIKIWNIFKMENSKFKIQLMNTLNNYHSTWIQFIILVNKKIFASGCYNSKIKIINSITFEKIGEFNNIRPTGWNTVTRLNDSLIAVGDRQIYILNVIQMKIVKVIRGDYSEIRTLKYLNDNTFLCSYQNGIIEQYDCIFFNKIGSIKENGAMYAIEELNDGSIIFGGTNSSVLIKSL